MRLATALIATVLLLPALTLKAQQPAMSEVPTTRVLAIGTLTGPRDAGWQNIMQSEVQSTVRLYLGGKIDQWFVRKDGKGVVFLMNTPTVEEARTLLEALPLGQAHRMTFELMPLGPLTPLRFLLNNGAATPAASAKP